MFKLCTWFEEVLLYMNPESIEYIAYKINQRRDSNRFFDFYHRKWIDENCSGDCILWAGGRQLVDSSDFGGRMISDIITQLLPGNRQLLIFSDPKDAMVFRLKFENFSKELIKTNNLEDLKHEIY